jgi:hypothetical protein
LKSILDPAFRYIPSIETDVRKTFDRIRREQREQSRTTSNRGAGTNVQQLRAVTNGMRHASGERDLRASLAPTPANRLLRPMA